MVTRREIEEKEAHEKQLAQELKLMQYEEEEQRRLAEELDKKISQEILLKESLIKEQKGRRRRAETRRIEIDFELDDDDARVSFLELSAVYAAGGHN